MHQPPHPDNTQRVGCRQCVEATGIPVGSAKEPAGLVGLRRARPRYLNLHLAFCCPAAHNPTLPRSSSTLDPVPTPLPTPGAVHRVVAPGRQELDRRVLQPQPNLLLSQALAHTRRLQQEAR
eukprot:351250-Chlamydomonas_euryale.AAC.5